MVQNEVSNTGIVVEVYSSINSLREIWKEFDREARQSIHDGRIEPMAYSFYQTYEWNEYVDDYYRTKGWSWSLVKRIEYFLVRVDGIPQAILPLLVTVFPKKKVEMTSWKTAGVNNAAVRYDLIREGDLHIFNRLLSFVSSRYKGFDVKLNDMPADSPFVKDMSLCEGLKTKLRNSYHVPLCDFENFDAWYASLSKNIHKSVSRCRNHFTHGDLRCGFRVFDRDNQPDSDYWKKLWRLYFLRKIDWKNRDRSPLRRAYAYYEAAREMSGGMKTQSFSRLDASRLFVFEINGEPAAFSLVYLWEGCAVMPKFAIDMRWSSHSPGFLLLVEIMKWCYAEGVTDFDFCRGDEPYKKRFGGVEAKLAGVRGRFV